ncbi:hypothetical protein D3C81_2119040 [compost metagenome]
MNIKHAVTSVLLVAGGYVAYKLYERERDRKELAEAREKVSKLIVDVPEIIKPSR